MPLPKAVRKAPRQGFCVGVTWEEWKFYTRRAFSLEQIMGSARTASGLNTACMSSGGQSSVDDRIRKPLPRPASIRSWAAWRDRFCWRHPILHESWSEVRNLFCRIRLLYTRGRASAVGTGRVYLSSRHRGLRLNKTSQGRKYGIERLLVFRPWASLQELQLFRCGWEAGREWALSTLGDPDEEPTGYSYSLDSILAEVGSNSSALGLASRAKV